MSQSISLFCVNIWQVDQHHEQVTFSDTFLASRDGEVDNRLFHVDYAVSSVAVTADGVPEEISEYIWVEGKKLWTRGVDIKKVSRKLAYGDRKDDQHLCVASDCDRYGD